MKSPTSKAVLGPIATSALVLAAGKRADAEPDYGRIPLREGDSIIEPVFGDVNVLREAVDGFYALPDAMATARKQLTRAVARAMVTLAEQNGCPTRVLQADYPEAASALEQHRRLGEALEDRYRVVRELDGLGETQGLTPDYRWKIRRADALYREAVRDHREMRAALEGQLRAELGYRRCAVGRDRSGGAARNSEDAQRVSESASRAWSQRPTKRARAAPPSTPSDRIIFRVDNQTCAMPVRVFVDGVSIGEVQGREVKGFAVDRGPHGMCLLPGADGSAQCGDPGTIRHAFLHHGWSISMRCTGAARGA